jgi:hypothetical protein
LDRENQKLYADRIVSMGPIDTVLLPTVAKEQFGVDGSARTAERYILRSGHKVCSTPTGPAFEETDKPKRVKSAERILQWINQTVFLDESTVLPDTMETCLEGGICPAHHQGYDLMLLQQLV